MIPRHRRILFRPESGVIRGVIALVLLGSVLVAVHSATSSDRALVAESASAQVPPNVVVIMTDDMRADDLRWMPNTRRLIAAAGATFTSQSGS
jgi:hypothetical protein